MDQGHIPCSADVPPLRQLRSDHRWSLSHLLPRTGFVWYARLPRDCNDRTLTSDPQHNESTWAIPLKLATLREETCHTRTLDVKTPMRRVSPCMLDSSGRFGRHDCGMTASSTTLPGLSSLAQYGRLILSTSNVPAVGCRCAGRMTQLKPRGNNDCKSQSIAV